MKIGPDFEITTDRWNWIVTESSDSTKKNGTPHRHQHRTFHPTLEDACEFVLSRRVAGSMDGGPEAVVAAIRAASALICDAVISAQREAYARDAMADSVSDEPTGPVF